MARLPDSRKQQRWLELILRCQRSQLSIREFCQRHCISEPSFFAWRRVLKQRGLLQDAPTQADASPFVKLTVAASEPVSAIEVVLGQRVLRVQPGFDADMLLQLVRLLETPPC